MKIIASDFDGTFVRTENVDPVDIEAVRKWQAAGNLFGFSSGRCAERMISVSARYTEGLIKPDFYVCGGGSIVCDAEGNIVWDRRVSAEIMEEVCDVAREMGVRRMICFSGMERHPFREGGIECPRDGSVTEYNHASLSTKDKDFSQAFADEVSRRLEGKINARRNGLSIDVVAAEVTKSTGIFEVMRRFGVERENVITVGDNYNDYDMIKDFKGYTVTRGVDLLKQIAHKVCKDFSEIVDDNM